MSKPLKRKGDYEIRKILPTGVRHPDGILDEVVAKLPEFVHIEQMDTNHWWIGIDVGKKKRIMVNFTARGTIKGTAYLD